jgi:hypothetical protein
MGAILRWGTVQINRQQVDAACQFFADDPYAAHRVRKDAEDYAGYWFNVELPADDARKLAAFFGKACHERDGSVGN